MKQKVLIIGGGGFLGSHLARSLVETCDVFILEKRGFSSHMIRDINDRLSIIEGDFGCVAKYRTLLPDLDCVFHLGWSTIHETSNKDCAHDVESNVIASLRLFDAIKKHPQIKIVFVSSGGTVYGMSVGQPVKETDPTMPICSYGISKLMIEKYLCMYAHLYGLSSVILRISNLYGEYQSPHQRQGIVSTFIHAILHNSPIEIWGDGSIVRDFVYVADAVSALSQAMTYAGCDMIFNIGSGMGTSVYAVAQMLYQISSKTPQLVFCPGRSFDVPVNVLDITRAREALAWEPRVPLQEGLCRTYRWFLERVHVAPVALGTET